MISMFPSWVINHTVHCLWWLTEIGLFFGVGSSVFVALYGIYVKKALVYVENNQWYSIVYCIVLFLIMCRRLLHYNTTLALMILIPFIIVSGELVEIRQKVTFFHEVNFWNVMTLTGVTGFLINIAVFLQIKVTTPLTNTISGTAKVCRVSFVGYSPNNDRHACRPFLLGSFGAT